MRIDTVAKINLETMKLELSHGEKVMTVFGENDPSPSELFCFGLVSCTAGVIYNYCQNNNLPIPDEIDTSFIVDEKLGNVAKVELIIKVPDAFPENRLKALEKAASKCDIKQAWLNPPEFSTVISRS